MPAPKGEVALLDRLDEFRRHHGMDE